MSVFHNNALIGAAQPSGVTFNTSAIGNSIHLNGSDEHLTKSFSGSATTTEGLYSIWVQRTAFGNDDGIFATRGTIDSATKELLFSFRTDNKLEIYTFQAGGAGNVLNLKTSRVFRDTGWYHIIFSYKTSEAVTSNRAALFVNGVAITELDTETFPTLNYGLGRPFASVPFGIGVSGETGSLNDDFFHGYIAQATFLDGQSIQGGDVTVSSFLDSFTYGTNGSQFVAKANADIAALATAAGGNSFCLDFADSTGTGAANLGNDISDNNNDFAPQNMAAANQSSSTPSKTFSTFNPNAHADNSYPGTFTLSEGNQTNVINSSNTSVKTTLPFVMSGSNIIRTQFTFTTVGHGGCGITGSRHTAGTYHTAGDSKNGRGEIALLQNGALVIDGNFNNTYFGGLSDGDVVDVIVNCDVGAVYFAVNGTLLSSATQSEIQAGTTTNAALVSSFVRRTAGEVFNFYAVQFNPTSTTIEYNSGQKSFTHSYSTITSLISLNTADLPAPDHQGIDYFDTTLYEGNGGGQRVGDFVPFTDTFNVTKSLIFNDGDSPFLERTPSSATSRTIWTWSGWIKRGVDAEHTFFSAGDAASDRFGLQFRSNANGSTIGVFDDISSSTSLDLQTSRGFRDHSKWYHIVVAVDTTQASASNRVKLYVDGVQITDFGQETYMAQSADTSVNNNVKHRLGRLSYSTSHQFDGYMAQVVLIDGTQLTPTSFGKVDTSTNRWVPIDVSGLTFGTNGFYLDMAIAPGTGDGPGNDVSGNNNDFSVNNFAAGDQSNDTPSNNLPVWDATDTVGSATPALSEGNLRFTGADNGGRVLTFPFTRGKWYWEVDVVDAGSSFYIGFATPAGIAFSSTTPWNNNAGSFVMAPTAGHFLGTNGSGTTNLVSNFTAFIGDGDRMAVAFDADNKFAYFGEVGSGGSGSTITFVGQGGATGDPTSGAQGTGAAPFGLNILDSRVFYHIMLAGGSDVIGQWIFDPAGFNGTPPTGYSALSQDNLDAGSSKITSWAWIKNRDATDDHVIVDRVRGIEKVIHSNSNAAQATETNTIQRFLQRGVEVGTDVQVNTVNEDYVLWQWLIGEEASTGSTFTGGSPDITSTGIVATPGHFSVGVYEGSGTDDDKVAHGLGGQIETLWVKHFAADTDDWMIWHKDLSSDSHQLHLNTTDSQDTTKNAWGSNPDFNTNTFRVGATDETNKNSTGNSHVFYAFRSIPGVCKVGSYLGNSNDDGAYISLGFKPSWFFVKEITVSDASHDWFVIDSTRYKYNGSTTAGGVNGGTLEANDSTIEETQTANFGDAPGVDFLADGIKLRTNSGVINNSSRTYIYIAMAEIAGNGTLPPIYGR
tara:strand:- start:954 stop:4955 length:4002 start_codon:yes stop_codon:yes gene_type:complete